MNQKNPRSRRGSGSREGASGTTWILRLLALGAVAFLGYQCGEQEGRRRGESDGRVIGSSRCSPQVTKARSDQADECRTAARRVCEEPQPPYGRMLCERLEAALR